MEEKNAAGEARTEKGVCFSQREYRGRFRRALIRCSNYQKSVPIFFIFMFDKWIVREKKGVWHHMR